jgi:hypothetical protein
MDGATARAERAIDDAELPDGLSRREYDVLAFERQWWKYAGAKEDAIKELFSMSATRYYQVLNTLVDRPEALAADPAPLARDIARPVCDAALRHGHGDFGGAVAAMRPVLGRMSLLGGSHAQQDVLEQTCSHDLPTRLRLFQRNALHKSCTSFVGHRKSDRRLEMAQCSVMNHQLQALSLPPC